MKVLGGVSRLRHNLTSLFAGRNEEEACFETARSARGFSKRATAVLDDKLAFSATLMRAGEVDAAFRMMREAEAEVRREETALFEIVENVAAAGTTKRRRRARLHLARTLATALVSFALLTLSVGGFALASAVVQRMSPDQAANAGGGASAIETEDAAFVREVRSVPLADGTKVKLQGRNVSTFNRISRGETVAPGQAAALLASVPRGHQRAFLLGLTIESLETFLASLPPEVAEELSSTILLAPVATDAVAHVKDENKSDKPAAGEAEHQRESSSDSEESSEAEPESEPTDADSEESESTKESKKKRDGGSSTDETELNLDGLLPKSD